MCVCLFCVCYTFLNKKKYISAEAQCSYYFADLGLCVPNYVAKFESIENEIIVY